MSQSPIQRFISELRRRHVPQTTAIYLVAAWAAIQFADVVVPNLNGPQWVVTAVIVASLVGFPVMLVVAWIFEWGPEGIHRTEAEADVGGAGPGERGAGLPGGPSRSAPWLAAVAVLVVGIGSALAVTFVLRSEEPDAGTGSAAPPTGQEGQEGGELGPGPRTPTPPGELEILGPAFSDSLRARMLEAFSALDSLNVGELAELGREAATESGLGVLVSEPREWRVGNRSPVPLEQGATLEVKGAAYDTAGVVVVTVDGDTVASTEEAQPTLPFATTLVGTAGAGPRTVVIVARTADGREVRQEFQIIQLPGGTP